MSAAVSLCSQASQVHHVCFALPTPSKPDSGKVPLATQSERHLRPIRERIVAIPKLVRTLLCNRVMGQSMCYCSCQQHTWPQARRSFTVKGVRVLVVCSCRANTGLKGEDFNRNLYIKTIDFATIHVYPQSFGLPNTGYQNVNEFYVGDRHLPRVCGSASRSTACCIVCAVLMLLLWGACVLGLRDVHTQGHPGCRGQNEAGALRRQAAADGGVWRGTELPCTGGDGPWQSDGQVSRPRGGPHCCGRRRKAAGDPWCVRSPCQLPWGSAHLVGPEALCCLLCPASCRRPMPTAWLARWCGSATTPMATTPSECLCQSLICSVVPTADECLQHCSRDLSAGADTCLQAVLRVLPSKLTCCRVSAATTSTSSKAPGLSACTSSLCLDRWVCLQTAHDAFLSILDCWLRTGSLAVT